MGGGIYWLPRDFLKLGQLMLNDGMWNGKRIVSKEWVKRASQANGKWSAQIAQFDVPLTVKGDRLSLQLPEGQGVFEGRLEKDGSLIRGHWIQPPTVNSGGNFNSPLVLRSRGKNRWRGEVIPLKDEWTLMFPSFWPQSKMSLVERSRIEVFHRRKESPHEITTVSSFSTLGFRLLRQSSPNSGS